MLNCLFYFSTRTWVNLLSSLIICLCFITTKNAHLVSSLTSITKREIHVVRRDVTSYLNITVNTKVVPKWRIALRRRGEEIKATENLKSRSGKNVTNLHRHHIHLRTAQWILYIIGWGFLLPVGAIMARYFRKFPMHWNEWYSCHVICQTSGYFLGTIGWFVGLLLASKQYSNDKSPHPILGVIVFTFTTIQMLAICWQPKKIEEEYYRCRRNWEIYHHVLGYVLIALIIADIFQEIGHQNHANKWRWAYIGIVVFLGVIVVSLEIFSRVKSKVIKNSGKLYTTSP